mmetsp:Transcript_30927/g.58737  ORF Transcript_30927/g.58737 Transcript_30927/m.58737 type:complete len:181 (-) Transcript_30927:1175-1717(-)
MISRSSTFLLFPTLYRSNSQSYTNPDRKSNQWSIIFADNLNANYFADRVADRLTFHFNSTEWWPKFKSDTIVHADSPADWLAVNLRDAQRRSVSFAYNFFGAVEPAYVSSLECTKQQPECKSNTDIQANLPADWFAFIFRSAQRRFIDLAYNFFAAIGPAHTSAFKCTNQQPKLLANTDI